MATTFRYQIPVEQTQWKFEGRADTAFTWEYEDGREKLLKLYDKGKQQQWDASTRIDWSQDLDPENPMMLDDRAVQIWGSPIWERLTGKERTLVRCHLQAQSLSQFMHGEQGALIATAKIVQTVPDADAKFYAATQVMDEARHVEVYERYLREKVELTYPINEHLRRLLDAILSDPRWDMKYLGMQILVEGLAMAAFKFLHTFSREPLVKELTHNVMRDEARHVAFGVLSLKDYYLSELNEKERREREEFTYESCRLMRDRFLAQEVWESMQMPVAECLELAMRSPAMIEFRRLLFMRIVPNIKRLGLLSPWLRERFTELGILQFEDMPADA